MQFWQWEKDDKFYGSLWQKYSFLQGCSGHIYHNYLDYIEPLNHSSTTSPTALILDQHRVCLQMAQGTRLCVHAVALCVCPAECIDASNCDALVLFCTQPSERCPRSPASRRMPPHTRTADLHTEHPTPHSHCSPGDSTLNQHSNLSLDSCPLILNGMHLHINKNDTKKLHFRHTNETMSVRPL